MIRSGKPEGLDRKIKNLTGNKIQENRIKIFGGQDNELWRKDGELGFALDMIKENKNYLLILFDIYLYIQRVHLKPIFEALKKKAKTTEVQTVIMGQRQKTQPRSYCGHFYPRNK